MYQGIWYSLETERKKWRKRERQRYRERERERTFRIMGMSIDG